MIAVAGRGYGAAVPSTSHLLAFALTGVVLVAIPGPSVLFIVGRALAHGRRAALTSVAGNTTGVVLIVVAVALGVGAVATASAAASTRAYTSGVASRSVARPAATESGLPERVPAWYTGPSGATCDIRSRRPP